MKNFENKNILIFGYGKSGKAVFDLIKNTANNIYIYDKKFNYKMQNNNKINKNNNKNNYFDNILNKNIYLIDNFDKLINIKLHFCIISPGVNLANKNIKYLKQQNIKILSELEFGASFCQGKIFAITGTNGKTTTVNLLYQIFKNAKKDCYLCGNVGTPISEIAIKTQKNSLIVCEVSSFQLETTKNFKPFASCILNIEPDHLDRHKNLENYCNIKNKINNFWKTKKVFNVDNINVNKLSKKYFNSINFSCNNNIFLKTINKIDYIFYKNKKIVSTDKINLLGKKNLENVLCAIILAKEVNISDKIIEQTLKNFKGLPNRLEIVKKSKNITYINDSKSTNILSTLFALETVGENVILLLGGSDKNLNFFPIFEKHKIKHTVIFGEVAKKIAKVAGEADYTVVDNFKTACKTAFAMARENDTVLLSPACASFDEFTSYEERGQKFVEYVNKFTETHTL
ncbi:MAG: UDP-N-acetylmuramoyl-L-alanine--D-glutamate ligase [Clostridia bacterium]|nr:UDP-N-acetylmuramoyl-L-alanine--D-glutamate ligase [Clostridia bacterium]